MSHKNLQRRIGIFEIIIGVLLMIPGTLFLLNFVFLVHLLMSLPYMKTNDPDLLSVTITFLTFTLGIILLLNGILKIKQK